MKKKWFVSLLSFVCVLACAFGLAACGDKGETKVEATGISLNRSTKIVDGVPTGDTLQFAIGQTATLTAMLTPDNATSEITWQSDKPEIASVDKSGKITALKSGNATVTATANGKSAWCAVTVTAPSVTDFTAEATAFVRNNIRPQVIGKDKDVKSETWSMQVNDDNTVDKLSILYIYASGKTERTVELADITLSSPLSFYDILDNAVRNIQCSVEKQTVFTFDAKYNYDSQDITNALYDSEKKTSNLKLISEATAIYETNTAYNYFVIANSNIEVYKVEVRKGSGSMSDIIKNFATGRKLQAVNIGSYTMSGTVIYSEGYTYEK